MEGLNRNAASKRTELATPATRCVNMTYDLGRIDTQDFDAPRRFIEDAGSLENAKKLLTKYEHIYGKGQGGWKKRGNAFKSVG